MSAANRESAFHTTRDGLRQRVRTWMPTSQPWGAVLLIHGFAEHSARYERTATLLANAGLAVRSFDHRGHGETQGMRGHVDRFELFLDDVREHLQALGELGVPTVLLGHSLGGLIAIRYVLSRAPLPTALVLSAPGLDADLPRVKRMIAPCISRWLPRLVMANPVQRGQLSRDQAVEDAYFSDPLVFSSATMQFASECFRAMDESQKGLEALRLPTWVGHGGDDTLVPPPISERLAALPNVERELFVGLRHEILNEPEGPEIVAKIIAFLERTIRPATS